jgi:hypothetical protein
MKPAPPVIKTFFMWADFLLNGLHVMDPFSTGWGLLGKRKYLHGRAGNLHDAVLDGLGTMREAP